LRQDALPIRRGSEQLAANYLSQVEGHAASVAMERDPRANLTAVQFRVRALRHCDVRAAYIPDVGIWRRIMTFMLSHVI
jgi:hypothetical protein